MKRKKIISGLIVLTLFLSGCGYTTSSSLPGRLKTVYVEPFRNKINYAVENKRNTYFPLLEVKVRDATVTRFLFDGHLRIDESDTADIVLRGDLVEYRRDALRYTDSNDVQEYRVQIFVDLVLWDTEKNELFWAENRFAGEATYFVSGPAAGTESAAVEEATVDLARRIVERTIENW